MPDELDVSTFPPQERVPFDFDAARDLAAKLRASANLVSTQQVPRRRGLASTARKDWQGTYAGIFDTRMTQCTGDAERLAAAMRDAATKVEQLITEAESEQKRRDRANEYLREHAAWREREHERNNDALPEFLDFSSHDEPEMPEMTGTPPAPLPVIDPNVSPRAS